MAKGDVGFTKDVPTSAFWPMGFSNSHANRCRGFWLAQKPCQLRWLDFAKAMPTEGNRKAKAPNGISLAISGFGARLLPAFANS
ncbi:MAG: hypothetical protein RSE31_02440 [Anaerovoracaceae bacterium]